MGLEQNGIDGAGAMDEEEQRQLEQGFLKKMPLLRWNPTALRQMVEAVARGRASALDPNERPSDALDSQGRIVGSDFGKDNGDDQFFGDMEAYRQRNMSNLPPGAEKPAARIMAPENSEVDLSRNPRYFGERQDGTPGQRFVAKALAGTNRMPSQGETRDNFTGNQDPNDQGMQAGGKTVADDESTPGGGPRGRGIRNIPAAGRFGLRRTL